MFTIARRASLAAAVSLAVLGTIAPTGFAQPQQNVRARLSGNSSFRFRAPLTRTGARNVRNNDLNFNIRLGQPQLGFRSGFLTGAATGASMTSNPIAAGLDNLYGLNPNYYPGYGGYGYGYDNVSGYLQGASSVITSQGQFMINNQQANLMKQQVRQAKMDTRRKIMEEWLWERQNIPTLQDELQRRTLEEMRRSRFNPPVTELWSGKALNDLLLNIQQMHAKGVYGPEVELDSDALKQINVTASGIGNAGLLKKDGHLSWPLGLRDLAPADETKELRSQIDSLVAEAINQAVNGRVEPGIINQLRRNTERMRQALTRNVGTMVFADYTKATRFLSDLDEAIKVLEQDNAGQYLNGKYAAQGKNVKELVEHMSKSGLRFAAAVPGGEAAYQAVRSAMADYLGGDTTILTTKPAPVAPGAAPEK